MASTERTELTSEAEERIASVIRSLAEDHVDRGIDISRPMRCDSCDIEKSSAGSSQYGAYALCNDCLLEFTLALAKGDVDNVAEYMTRPPEYNDGSSGPSSDPLALEPRALHRGFQKRDKLMPSNEPC